MTDTTTLAPCPFCGGCAVHFHYSGSACVGCKDCIAYLGGEESDLKPDALAEAWNRRAPAPANFPARITALLHEVKRGPWEDASGEPLQDDAAAALAWIAAPPAQEARVPLSDEKRREMWRVSTFRGNGGQIDWFIEGTRAAERAHGITAAQKETP